MCGIAGILRWEGERIPKEAIESMTSRLSHRGPDGSGVYWNDYLALGHRRLSIIDPEGGAQPLWNEDNKIAITYNGEIYNFRELRQELLQKGHIFKTRSDTEVVVHAWEEWGKHCVERFRGMFAFAVADFKKRVLFAARDPFGIKPFYYLKCPKHMAFASELQAFHALSDFQPEMELEALDQYLAFQYIAAPKTIFKNVFKLPPSHRMIWHFDGRFEEPECYWRLDFKTSKWKNEGEMTEALESVLRDSVRAHLVSDVPFGAFLSGGVDSSLVVSLMVQEMTQPVETFSIAFSDAAYDETKYAQQVAERWQTRHHVETVEPNAIQILPELVKHYGEPFGDYSAVPTFYVSKMARSRVPMVLSGDGGDEAFGGYERHAWWMQSSSRNARHWRERLYPLAGFLMPWRYPPKKTVSSIEKWIGSREVLKKEIRRNLWRPECSKSFCGNTENWEPLWRSGEVYLPMDQIRYLDYQTYLPGDILTKVDIASMMHGLEVRTPLIDVHVVEFAATIPPESLVSQSASGSWMTKRILKKILSKYFPKDFVERPKRGFTMPLSTWLNPDKGALKTKFEERILHSQARIYQYLDAERVRELVRSPEGIPRRAHALWLLLFLEYWLEAWTTRKG